MDGVRMVMIVGEQRGLLRPSGHLQQLGIVGFRLVETGEGSGVPVPLIGAPRT